MRDVRITAIAALVGASVLSPVNLYSAESKEAGDTLPEAKSGECYARVAVPAQYRTETVTAITKEATESITVTPAEFIDATEQVLIQEASTKLVPIPAEYDTEEQSELISPSRRSWVRGGLESNVGASKGMLADLEGYGVTLNSVEPGQCFYEYHKPAAYGEESIEVLVEQATETLDVIPASFSTSDKQVMITPASKRLVVVPTVYKTESEQILVEPAHSEWQIGRGLIERIDNVTGEIMCRVDVPARYETVEKQVVAAPARTTTIMQPAQFDTIEVKTLVEDAQEVRTPVPAKFATLTKPVLQSDEEFHWLNNSDANSAEFGSPTGTVVCRKETEAVYETYERKIVSTPGSFSRETIVEQYEDVAVKKLVNDAESATNAVAEESATFEQRIKVSDARMEWRAVLCETNVTPDIVKRIQAALNGRGYEAGTVDGLLGRGTMTALEEFQEDESLARGGLTYSTIEALGIDL